LWYFLEKTESDWDQTVEYEIDSEDENFLSLLNSKLKSRTSPENSELVHSSSSNTKEYFDVLEEKPKKVYIHTMDEDTFELIMDYLEKQSFKQVCFVSNHISFIESIEISLIVLKLGFCSISERISSDSLERECHL
jgi:hypothetical protein